MAHSRSRTLANRFGASASIRSAGTSVETFEQDRPQRRSERLIDQLVHAQGAEHRVAADALHQRGVARYDPRLRTAEQFVAAEADDSSPPPPGSPPPAVH